MKPLRYSVHLAHIKFAETDQGKLRPVIVLTEPAGKFNTALIAPIYSSALAESLASDFAVDKTNLATYGLVTESIIRLHRITELPIISLLETLGHVPPPDQPILQQKLQTLFGLTTKSFK